MTDNYIVYNDDRTLGYLHAVKNLTTNDKYEVHHLHCHDNIYEIIMLISGDLEFHVECSVYKPKQFDIIIVRPNELHKLISCSNEPYERYTLHISSEFFIRNKCERFESIFLDRKLGENNLISANIVKEYLLDQFMRIEDYFSKKEYLVTNAAIIEFLYHLNSANTNANYLKPSIKNERINDIITYINEHITDNITLEHLSDKFYIDKFYLCKAFKKNTSYTINQYITYKRVLLARTHYENGLSLTESAAQSGFNTYSNFYKAHIKFIGTSPRS